MSLYLPAWHHPTHPPIPAPSGALGAVAADPAAFGLTTRGVRRRRDEPEEAHAKRAVGAALRRRWVYLDRAGRELHARCWAATPSVAGAILRAALAATDAWPLIVDELETCRRGTIGPNNLRAEDVGLFHGGLLIAGLGRHGRRCRRVFHRGGAR